MWQGKAAGSRALCHSGTRAEASGPGIQRHSLHSFLDTGFALSARPGMTAIQFSTATFSFLRHARACHRTSGLPDVRQLEIAELGQARVPMASRLGRHCVPCRDGRDFRREDGASRLLPGHDDVEAWLHPPYSLRRGRAVVPLLAPQNEGSGAPKRRINKSTPDEARHAPCDRCVSPLGAPPRRFSGPQAALFVEAFLPRPSASSSRAAVVPPGGVPRPPGASLARRCSRAPHLAPPTKRP